MILTQIEAARSERSQDYVHEDTQGAEAKSSSPFGEAHL